jgi:phenylalanyl-tRNA synthetase alpha chain
MKQIPETQWKVLDALQKRSDPITVTDLAEQIGLDQSPVMAACSSLDEQNCLRIEEETFDEYRLGKEAIALGGKPLPERIIASVLVRQGGQCPLSEIPTHCSLTPQQVGQSLRWLIQKKLATKEGDVLKLIDGAGRGAEEAGADERLLDFLGDHGVAVDSEIVSAGVDLPAALSTLSKRKGFLDVRQRTRRIVELTETGRSLISEGAAPRRSVNQLTSEMLSDGSWRDVDIRPYDVSLPAAPVHPGKEHPFQRVVIQARRAFIEMGFEEVTSPFVESSFWNFDALFQPQDHPARDMHDTFYVARPGPRRLPDDDPISRKVSETHETGGDTGSVGWRYRWDRELASRPVLRTHTTAATVRALAENPRGPRKVFSVGPVFRHETVDYKHLPVFYQIEGIIIDSQGSLAALIGTLKAFFRKMGVDRITLRPGYFPYTEPSMEIFVWNEEHKDWLEMGGSGIFRPEVTLPLGCTDPVMAWGLGLSRLPLLRHGIEDIREIHYTHLEWLKRAALCR